MISNVPKLSLIWIVRKNEWENNKDTFWIGISSLDEHNKKFAAVGQWVSAFAPQAAEGWVFESQTYVVKTGSDSSTDHFKRMPRVTVSVARKRTLTAQWP